MLEALFHQVFVRLRTVSIHQLEVDLKAKRKTKCFRYRKKNLTPTRLIVLHITIIRLLIKMNCSSDSPLLISNTVLMKFNLRQKQKRISMKPIINTHEMIKYCFNHHNRITVRALQIIKGFVNPTWCMVFKRNQWSLFFLKNAHWAY